MYSTVENIKTSLKLAWKHKIIWVFALMVGVGGIGMNFVNFLETEDRQDQQRLDSSRDRAYIGSYNVPANDFYVDKNVLGASADIPMQIFPYEDIGFIFQLILKLTIPFFIFVIYILITRFITLCWSQASMTDATIKIISQENISLTDTSKVGFEHLKSFFVLNIYKILAGIAFGIIFVIYTFIFNFLNDLSSFLFLLPTIIILIIATGVFTVSFAFASRLIIYNKLSPSQAVGEGIRLFKSNFNNSMKLLLGNYLISATIIIGMCFIIIPLWITVTLILTSIGFGFGLDNLYILFPTLIITMIPLSIILGFVAQVVLGYIISFYELTWTKLFLNLTQKSETAEVQNAAGQ